MVITITGTKTKTEIEYTFQLKTSISLLDKSLYHKNNYTEKNARKNISNPHLNFFYDIPDYAKTELKNYELLPHLTFRYSRIGLNRNGIRCIKNEISKLFNEIIKIQYHITDKSEISFTENKIKRVMHKNLKSEIDCINELENIKKQIFKLLPQLISTHSRYDNNYTIIHQIDDCINDLKQSITKEDIFTDNAYQEKRKNDLRKLTDSELIWDFPPILQHKKPSANGNIENITSEKIEQSNTLSKEIKLNELKKRHTSMLTDSTKTKQNLEKWRLLWAKRIIYSRKNETLKGDKIRNNLFKTPRYETIYSHLPYPKRFIRNINEDTLREIKGKMLRYNKPKTPN